MEPSILREILFELFFLRKEGIPAKDFIEEMSFIPETYKVINGMCEKNIEYFDSFDSVSKIKEISNNGKKFHLKTLGAMTALKTFFP